MFDFMSDHWAFAPYLSLVVFLSFMSLRERRPSEAARTGRRDRDEPLRNVARARFDRRSDRASVCGA